MILFTVPSSPFGARIRIQAAEKGLSLDLAEPPGGLGSGEFFRINPFGKVPVLRDGETDIIESAVIQEYLEDRYPEPNHRGASPVQAAAVRTFVAAVDLYLFPALFGLRGRGRHQSGDLQPVIDDIVTVIDRLARLKSGGYLCGETPTLADFALAPAFFYTDLFARRIGFESPFDRQAPFAEWWERVTSLTSFGQVIADLELNASARKEAASDQI